MIRKLVYILPLYFLITGISVQAYALPNRGTLQIQVEYGEDGIPDGEVTLYPVGTPSGETYLLTSGFGGGLVKKEDVGSSALAVWLSQLTGIHGISRILDADGNASFYMVPEGLYLITHTQNNKNYPEAKPILVSVPYNGCWNVGVLPASGVVVSESPRTGDHISPLIGAMGIVLTMFVLWVCVERFKGK